MTNWLENARKTNASFLAPSEIPARYATCTIDQIPVKPLEAVARKYGRNFWTVAPKGVAPLLVGAAGQYKTVTAAVIARAVRDVLLVDTAWCNCAAEFVAFDRDTFDQETKARMRWLKTVPFLVMDDFTQVLPNSRSMRTLVEIGVTRFDSLLPTLWTGNIQFTKKYDDVLTGLVGACMSRRLFDGAAGYITVVK